MGIGSDQVLYLSPGDFVDLLEVAALCPAFSEELLGAAGAVQRCVFLTEDAFDGRLDRRQFFRNQSLKVYYEKAATIREALDMLMCLARLDPLPDDMALRSVLNTLHFGRRPGDGQDDGCAAQEGDGEDACDRQFDDDHVEDLPSHAACVADFTLETARYPFLIAWGPGDIFFVRRSAPVAGVDGDPPPSFAGAPLDAGGWFLGETSRVISYQDQRVSLVQLRLYSLDDTPASLSEGVAFDLVPVDYLPSVLRREIDALRRLCEGTPGFSNFVQQLVFPTDRRPPEVANAAHVVSMPSAWGHGTSYAQLNEQQRASVDAACGAGPLSMIQGPPGTGKTDVAAAIVEAWIRQDPDVPVLVATGTHAARSHISARLEAAGIKIAERRPKNRMLKTSESEAPQVFVETVYMAAEPRERVLPRVVMDESTQITEIAALVALGQGCERLVLIGDPQQLGPVSTVGQVAPNGRGTAFKLECESVFELMRRRHGIEPIRLHVQHRMDPRLWAYPAERFYQGLFTDAAQPVRARGAPELDVMFPCAERGGGEEERMPLIFIDTTGVEDAVEAVAAGTRSLYNLAEARIAAQVAQGFQDAGVNVKDLAVLVPYGAQRDRIARELHPDVSLNSGPRRWLRRSQRARLGDADPFAHEPHPQVHTVDGFQGCERDFVILSAVRSCPDPAWEGAGAGVDNDAAVVTSPGRVSEGCCDGGDAAVDESQARAGSAADPGGSDGADGASADERVGSVRTAFIGDPRRVCVILTRAKRGLIVIGDGALLAQDDEWSSWLREARPRRISARAWMSSGDGRG